METALGQFSRKGPVGCWEFAPAMRGIGMASVMISFFGALYYIMIMVWGGVYLVHSFRSIGSRLPWSDDVGNLKFLSACFFFLFIKLLNIIRRSFIQNQYNNNDRS
jgi:SNF family Na+-dependent transporter